MNVHIAKDVWPARYLDLRSTIAIFNSSQPLFTNCCHNSNALEKIYKKRNFKKKIYRTMQALQKNWDYKPIEELKLLGKAILFTKSANREIISKKFLNQSKQLIPNHQF